MVEYVSWTRMEDGQQKDWDLLFRREKEANADVVERVLNHLKLLDVDWGGYRINRCQHSLQSATLAERGGAEEELIVAALLHDIGDIISPYNHSEFAAAVLRPYVSEKTYWIIKYHGLFQSYYYNEYVGGDPNARDQFKDHPHYQACVDFCRDYDQNAFDPDYDTLPIEHFIPAIKRVFASNDDEHLKLTL